MAKYHRDSKKMIPSKEKDKKGKGPLVTVECLCHLRVTRAPSI